MAKRKVNREEVDELVERCKVFYAEQLGGDPEDYEDRCQKAIKALRARLALRQVRRRKRVTPPEEKEITPPPRLERPERVAPRIEVTSPRLRRLTPEEEI